MSKYDKKPTHEKAAEKPLGRALEIYSELSCSNPDMSEAELWRVFQQAIAQHPELIEVAQREFTPPPMKTPGYHDRLSRWLVENGVPERETMVKQALCSGDFITANRLRNDNLAAARAGAFRLATHSS